MFVLSQLLIRKGIFLYEGLTTVVIYTHLRKNEIVHLAGEKNLFYLLPQ